MINFRDFFKKQPKQKKVDLTPGSNYIYDHETKILHDHPYPSVGTPNFHAVRNQHQFDTSQLTQTPEKFQERYSHLWLDNQSNVWVNTYFKNMSHGWEKDKAREAVKALTDQEPGAEDHFRIKSHTDRGGVEHEKINPSDGQPRKYRTAREFCDESSDK